MDSLAQDRELVPRHVRTHEEMARFHHEDIPDLTDDEIRAEEVLATVLGEWASATYNLTRAEREIAKLAQRALDIAADPTATPTTQLQAGAQFERLVRSLRLPAEEDHHGHAEAAPRFPRLA